MIDQSDSYFFIERRFRLERGFGVMECGGNCGKEVRSNDCREDDDLSTCDALLQRLTS